MAVGSKPDVKVSVHSGGAIVLLLFILLMLSCSSKTCGIGGGLTITVDGIRHTFSWDNVR